jgi:hypothetical protein
MTPAPIHGSGTGLSVQLPAPTALDPTHSATRMASRARLLRVDAKIVGSRAPGNGAIRSNDVIRFANRSSAAMTTPEQMRDAWDKFASGYDEAVTPFSMRIAEDVLRRVDIHPGMRFLDVASGGGAISIPAARLGAQVLATDFSAADEPAVVVAGLCGALGAEWRWRQSRSRCPDRNPQSLAPEQLILRRKPPARTLRHSTRSAEGSPHCPQRFKSSSKAAIRDSSRPRLYVAA